MTQSYQPPSVPQHFNGRGDFDSRAVLESLCVRENKTPYGVFVFAYSWYYGDSAKSQIGLDRISSDYAHWQRTGELPYYVLFVNAPPSEDELRKLALRV